MRSWYRKWRGAPSDAVQDHSSTSISNKPRTSLYPTCDTGEYEPPWVSARQSNIAHCAFYQLPKEVVSKILGDLDHASRSIAQRTCGLFLAVLFDQALYRKTAGKLSFRAPLSLDPLDHGPFTAADKLSMRKQIDHILNRDRFCNACHQFREDGRYDRAMQLLQGTLWCSHCHEAHKRPLFSSRQRQADPATRVCVLAEGKTQICAHKPMGWKEVQDLGPFDPAYRSRDFCQHPDHDPPSHVLTDSYECPEYTRPSLDSSSRHGSDLSLVFHVTLLMFHLHPTTPVTRAWLQEQLTAKAQKLEKMLCPHVTVHDGQLMLPFSPGCCACFESLPRTDKSCTSSASSCCRCDGVSSEGLAGYFIPKKYATPHEYYCDICWTSYEWLRHGPAVYLKICQSPVRRTLSWPAQDIRRLRHGYWVHTLHPESWGILEDDELRHVAWCDDIYCSTRWRWERLSQLLVGVA